MRENWSNEYTVDKTIKEREMRNSTMHLILPGGVINPDKLRRNEDALGFVRDFFSRKEARSGNLSCPTDY